VSVEFVLFHAFDIGVGTLLLVVFQVFFFSPAEKFANLLRRHGAGGIGLQIDRFRDGRCGDWRRKWRWRLRWSGRRNLTESATHQQTKRKGFAQPITETSAVHLCAPRG
jgi:hypothetical protein